MNTYTTVESCQIVGLAQIFDGVFGYKTDGEFVEVGAYDGLRWSNTYGLAHIGWKGLYIEPVEEYFNKCVVNHANHKNVTVVRALVSDAIKSMKIIVRQDMATVDESFISMMNLRNGSYEATITSSKLDDILAAYNIPAFFDLLVIDVEGHEMSVLNGFDMWRYYPKMIIIETHAKNDNVVLRANAYNIDRHMRNHERCEYVRIYSDEINSVYVRTEY